MSDLFSLSGKRILITGGTRGIGRAISLRFAGAGASVVANYIRNETAAAELKKLAEEESLSIEYVRADITSQKGIEAISSVMGDGRGLDGLVHCAATGVHRPVEDLTTRHFDWTFNLNIKSFFELVRALLPLFNQGGSILAVSSQGAVRAVPSYSLVGATKGALEAFSRHLAVELISKGIRVNILSPGSVMTDAWKAMPDSEKRIEETIHKTPLGRLVTAEEVAWAAQFLCSNASSAIIGQTLVIDGGAGIVS